MNSIFANFNKIKIFRSYWSLIFYLPFFIVISIFSKPNKEDISLSTSEKSSNKIVVLTLLNNIDSKFSNVLPYIEPSGLDHFSYSPLRIKNIQEEILKVYGYDILEKNYNPYIDCKPVNRKGILNNCFGYNYWKNLTYEKWQDISTFTNVNFILIDKPLPLFKNCFIKSNLDKKYYFYIINNALQICPIINSY